MKSKLVLCVSLLMLVQAVASAATVTVPSRTNQTIQDGIDYAIAHGYDTVEVAQGVYSGYRNINLDFHGHPITVKSQKFNPNDPCCWTYVYATIIDCCGVGNLNSSAADTGNANRAFYFHTNEGSDSQVIGFTIRNGYARGPKGADARTGFDTSIWRGIPYTGRETAPWQTFPSWQQAVANNPAIDPCTLPPAALDGNDATPGNGYGGAILCQGSSPTISYCVIENCTATGALGGSGASGLPGPWSHYTWADFNWEDGNTYHQLLPTATLKNTNDGQGGGNGGMGSGNGYGGAIAMLGICSPEFDSCRFINNSAQGGQGGAGGKGGNAAYAPTYNSGLESGGGNAGVSDGNGIGGAIYASTLCEPVFNNCLFENNVAKTGPRGNAGGRGFGNLNITNVNGVSTRVPSGQSSEVHTSPNPAIAGGAAYFGNFNAPTFTDCNFINNKAYVAFVDDPNTYPGYSAGTGYLYPQGVTSYNKGTAEDILGYTVGGAVYFGNGCQGAINTCDFINNGGGALYFGQGCNNFNINNDSAVGRGQPGSKNLFQGNNAPDDFFYGISYNSGTAYFYFVPSSGSGGAIYVSQNCYIDIISNSIFNRNTAKENGGAIESQSDLTISDCAFSDNTAIGNGDLTGFLVTGFGGAVDVYSGSNQAITATNCSFISNKSIWGGALSTEMFNGSFNNCFFTDNTAQTGGALELSMGQSTVTIAGNVFIDNVATSGDGGGIDCFYTSANIQNCEFFDNSAEGTVAYGGGIDIYGAEGTGHTIRNSLFVGNSSSYNGGAVVCEGDSVSPLIQSCTFSQNTANQSGGSIYADWSATPQIKDCIFQKSNNYAIYKDNAGGSESYCLFYNNPDGNLSGITVPSGSHNLVGDPLFVTGTLGDYYLSQVAAGQAADSCAINSGSDTALALGLNTKTTATNDAGDSGQVDMGYHFSRAADMPQFSLTTSVVGGIGTISVLPAPLPDGNYYAGTVVTVTATPQANWVIKQWTGTDNDSEVTATQTIVMNSNRAVTVEFKIPTYLYVPQLYANITVAMADANDGDIIVVSSGVYPSAQIQLTKSVEIRSAQPENPDYVAQTILDFNNRGNGNSGVSSAVGGIFIPQGMNSGCILNGFTIRNSNWVATSGDAGTNPGENGGDGLGGEGGAIWIGPGSGPVIKNCIIRDNSMQGGDGANGANADLYHNAGRGGWGAWARGGAVYCSEYSHPQFINCQILNNQVVGGFGGNGGNELDLGGFANYGGNYSRADWWDYDPRDINPDWVEGDLWEKWTEMAYDLTLGLNTFGKGHRGRTNYQYLDDYGIYQYGYIGDYRYYSGYGGGVYVNTGSNVTFTNCVISGNVAEGGFSGLGGTNPRYTFTVAPLTKYEIPAFGGGVYVAAASNVVFNGCVISSNTASNPTFDHTAVAASGYLPTGYDPLHHYHIDSYLGHGGGVCAEDTAKVTFVDCNFTGNNASLGGGLFGSNVSLVLSDCEFVSNSAYQGGGVFGQNGSISINKSIFNSNTSSPDANDPNVLGQGGALNFLSANANIVDTSIISNSAGEIGGGLYLGGLNSTVMRNCIVRENSASQMGGAAAATDSAQLKVANCTIVNNNANLGGGLFGDEGGYINVINSIIWGNFGNTGAQLALSMGTLQSSEADVSYSDVGPPAGDINKVVPSPALTVVPTNDANILANTLLGSGIDLVGNPQYTGASAASGTFKGGLAAGIGIESGIILTSGLATNALPPDNGKASTDNGMPGDSDLNALLQARGGSSAGLVTYDAAVLEFTFNSQGGNLFFNFVFASSEYNQYVNSQFNDVFGFFLDGVNIALIPGTTTPVAINTVNGGNPLGTNASNPQYFHNNSLSDGGPFYSIHYDGFTSVFTAHALNLSSGTHTIKLAIADTSDHVLDSAVFIQAGSFSDKASSDPISVDKGCTIVGWNLNVQDSNKWDPNFVIYHNINTDPCFIDNFYLSQITAGQLSNSPCVNTGSADVNSPDINLGGYSTSTDSNADVGIVDMGYHYSAFTPPQYYLNFTAVSGNGLGSSNISPGSGYFSWYKNIPLQVTVPVPAGSQVLWTGTDNDNLTGPTNSVTMNANRTVTVAFVSNSCNLTVQVVGNRGGTVTPMSGTYPRGTVVTLTATPDSGYRIDSWQGTDNDSSYARTNTVTMSGDKIVNVTFSLPQTLTVPGQYSSIQDAIEAARSGDIVSVASGVYDGRQITINKEITIAGTNPDDPCVVAATVISSNGYASRAVVFGAGATENTVLDGFTIIGGTWYIIASAAPASGAGLNGIDGGSIAGGAVYINSGASPTIRNCVVRDTTITGGNASNGNAADATHPAGRGGWAGGSYGGGVFIDSGANPTLINCTITNCSTIGGNAGNGGASSGTYQGTDYEDANHGGSWSDANTFPYQSLIASNGQPYLSDYEFYSGLGGGVFCNSNSRATFIDCNITNNTASGGMSGIGGDRPWTRPDPVTAYRIPSYGGGVFCSTNSEVYFIGCNVTGNVSPKPDTTYHINPYLGHGGGIAILGGADIQLENSTISGNTSAVGGGVFWIGGSPAVLDCNIINNVAYVGGGIYATESSGQIKDCSLRSNFAGVSPNDVDVVAGQGGGIFGSSINADIIDCVLTNNISSASGAGIHIYGPASTETIIRNCLLTDNQSGRDGAGISINWGAIAVVENCTLYNNQTTGLYGISGDTGFGGGLYCSYDASTDVNNSIFWDNNSLFGPEIYIGTDTNHEPTCGNVTVTFSDIQGGQTGIYVGNIGNSCPFTWGAGNISSDPQFVNASSDDFHLKSIAAGQTVNSPCIDAGGNPAQLHGLFKYSTSTLGTPDTGVVDIGYHYPIADYCRRWDLFIDNAIDFRDLAIFASSWVGAAGSETYGYNATDLADFTECWLVEMEKDLTPPTPDPMTWAIPPRVSVGNSVEMKASLASDDSGTVYYQFEDVNGTPTGWQVDPCYTATGLNPTGEYCFRVRARDKYNNVTAWSDYNAQTGLGCVTNIGDVCAPSPAPTMIVSAGPTGNRDVNDTSEQFEWYYPLALDWWHKIVVDVTGITDNITPADQLEVRFICSDSDFSSDNVIPATYRPIRIGHPVSIGGRIPDGVGAKEGSYRLTWNGANRIVYDVFVNSYGGAIGVKLNWHVRVYDTSGNSVSSATYQIPQ
ncbi:MAG: choice-of-anchor L domain-containing protein [Sedimentisphaerales bacterium]